MIPPYAAGPEEPLGQEVAPHQGPPGDPSTGPAFLEPRVRPSPYGPSRTRINGKTPPSLKDEFFTAPPEQMDTAASAPQAIVPMEEQNTGVKRSKEAAAPKSKAKAKKKKDEIAATQSPPSLPPPPPGGAAALRATEEPDVEPASASSANAPTSVPHYRQKEGSAPRDRPACNSSKAERREAPGRGPPGRPQTREAETSRAAGRARLRTQPLAVFLVFLVFTAACQQESHESVKEWTQRCLLEACTESSSSMIPSKATLRGTTDLPGRMRRSSSLRRALRIRRSPQKHPRRSGLPWQRPQCPLGPRRECSWPTDRDRRS